jgi:hypothetical protein
MIIIQMPKNTTRTNRPQAQAIYDFGLTTKKTT